MSSTTDKYNVEDDTFEIKAKLTMLDLALAQRCFEWDNDAIGAIGMTVSELREIFNRVEKFCMDMS